MCLYKQILKGSLTELSTPKVASEISAMQLVATYNELHAKYIIISVCVGGRGCGGRVEEAVCASVYAHVCVVWGCV